MDASRVKIRVHGLVQGVFYRYSAKEFADANGISGYARNFEDGSVEIIAEGKKRNLEKFLDWAKRGSYASKVERVESEWGSSKGEFKSFKIL